MENFETLKNIDDFCTVIVKKTIGDKPAKVAAVDMLTSNKAAFEENNLSGYFEADYGASLNSATELEEPLVDVFDEEDHIRVLVQCRCREQQVTFHPAEDGILVCREECYRERDGPETCRDVCRKLNLPTDGLQLDNMLFIIAKCNNNNTLEAMIPKTKQ